MASRHKGTELEKLALGTYLKLLRAAESITIRVNADLPKFGLTESQFGVLEALYHLGPLYQREIGDKLLRTGGNITLVVDNLEKLNLAKRERGSDDRRYIRVHLTKEGKSLIEKVFPQHVKSIVAEMNVLSEKDQLQMQKFCKKIGLQDNKAK